MQKYEAAKEDKDIDPHYREMLKYEDAPNSWYAVTLVISAIISLVVIYRDYNPGMYPLLPWMMSTENCEHVFGESRHLVSDWTVLDFIYMLPKLEAKLTEATITNDIANAKTRATGYAHTYFDCSGIDLRNLVVFLLTEEINVCSKHETRLNLPWVATAAADQPRAAA